MWSVLLVLQLLYAVSDEQYAFSDHKKRFNHLVVDYKTGAVYVGAVNKIYQLSPDLKIVRHAITGPVYDSIPDSLGRSCNATKLINNFNKVLVIDHAHDRLISCGTALQGMCSVLSLNDINIRRDVPKALAANNPTASTVAFIAPGPPDPNTSQVLYIGVTFTDSFPNRYNIPAVSSLSLEEHKLFDVAKIFCEFCHSDKVTGTRLYINTMYRDRHIVNYVYGFSSGEFSYFLTTQKGTNGEIYSKIIRICHSDEQYYSYTEIPLSCKANGTDYNLVEAAYITKFTNVSEKLGVFKDEDVLYALFHTEGKQPLSDQKRSALCLYTVRDINKKFGANIDKCFRGEGMRGLEFIWPNRECVRSEHKIEGAKFCGTNINTPLGGEMPIVSEPLIEFKETLTSIAATSASNYSIVVFAGTKQGHIKKIVLKNPSTAVEYADIVIDKDSPVNKDLSFDTHSLCVYSLKAIRHKFLQNIQNCFSGNGYHGLDFISPSLFCTATKIDFISEDFCGLNVNTPIGGDQPVEAVPVAVFTKRLTAVAATVVGDYTVLFAGTAQGHLKKIVVESATSAFEYGDIVVDEGSPVNKDLLFDNQLKHLYVMTERKVSKVKIQECRVYDSCLKCLGANVPYCGWCYLENKCSLRSNCHDFSNDSLYISYRSGRCTTIAKVTPDQLQLSSTQSLNLYLEDLPPVDRNFLCKFTVFDLSLTTNATRKSYGVTCTTPNPRSLPPIPAGQHHVTAKLTVRSAQGIDFVATNLTFFDCNTYSSCTQCVSSSFPCDWCLDAHRCTHDPEENCRNDIFINGVSRKGPSYRSGPGFCPAITFASYGTREILVPDGAKMVIKVKFHIIGQFIVQTRFVCQFNLEGRVTHVNAELSADTIYCEAVKFTYTSHAPNITASFAVIWGGSKPIDNPSDIHILIYRCNTMAKNNCSNCLALPEKFGCGWCHGSDKCEVQEQCGAPSIWLNRTQTCK